MYAESVTQVTPSIGQELECGLDSNFDIVLSTLIASISTYYDPLVHCKNDLQLEIGLQILFSLESICLREDKAVGPIDEQLVKKFEQGIEFKNGCVISLN